MYKKRTGNSGLQFLNSLRLRKMNKTAVLIAILALGLFFTPPAQGLIADIAAGLLDLVHGILSNTKVVVTSVFNSMDLTLKSLSATMKDLQIAFKNNPLTKTGHRRLDPKVKTAIATLRTMYKSSITGVLGTVNRMAGRAGLLDNILKGVQTNLDKSIMDVNVLAEKCLSADQVNNISQMISNCAHEALETVNKELLTCQEIVRNVLREVNGPFKERVQCVSKKPPLATACINKIIDELPIVVEMVEMNLVPQPDVNKQLKPVLDCASKIVTTISSFCK